MAPTVRSALGATLVVALTALAAAATPLAALANSAGVATLAAAATPPGVAPTASADQGARALQELSVDQVAALLDQGAKLHVFDNNSRERYAASHLPGAIWLRYDTVEEGNLPPDKSATLVFYCANEHCTASPMAARSALDFGYRNVFVMPAGIRGWEMAGKAVEGARRRP